MRKSAFILGLALSFPVLAPNEARAQSRRDSRQAAVCVYQNNNFGGWEECFAPGDEMTDLGSHRNNISSIRIFGNARVMVYDNRDFGGIAAEVTSDRKDLAQVYAAGVSLSRSTWNDRIESLQVFGPGSRPNPPRNDSRNDPRDDRGDDRRNPRGGGQDSFCVYEESEYRGRYECFNAPDSIRDLVRMGNWSDRISSIRMFGNGRMLLYRDINFTGDSLVVERDMPDLKQYRLRGPGNWDNQISSFEIQGSRSRR